MKNSLKRMSAGLLALLMVLSLVFAGIPGDVFAASITYSTSSNSGTRDEICTSLDGTGAEDYYTSAYTFDTLSQQGSSQLLQSLRTLMTSTHKKISSYTDCKNYANRTDCENEDGRVVLLYTSYSATMSQYNGWNREHVWPQSLGGGNTSGGGADLHHVRPSDAGVNSSRGNKKYGDSNNGTAKYGSNPATGCLGGHYNSTYFEPLDNVKGDVARICLYVYVRWGSNWGADSITEVFQSVDVLLEWMELDPVDTWEMGRNEVVENIQGNRNVFIDYPEYAWLLFGRDVPEGITTPSDNDGVTATPGGNTGSGGSSSGGSSSNSTTTNPTWVSTPQTGVAYKLGLYQQTNGKNIYFNGKLHDPSYYLGSTEDPAEAADVYLESADGGYKLTFNDGGSKKYIKVYQSGTYTNAGIDSSTDTIFTWDAAKKAFVTEVNGEQFYLGTYSHYSSIGASPIDKISSSFTAQMCTFGSSSGGSSSGNSGSAGNSGNSGDSGNSGSTTTTKPATQPSTQATQPSTSTPSSAGANNSVITTRPSSSANPAPLATNSVPAPTLPTGDGESNPNSWILIVILVAIALIGGGVAVYFFVIRPKKEAPVTETEAEEETNNSNE